MPDFEADVGPLGAQQRELLAYWRSLAPDETIPARSAFEPLDIPALLPLVTLTEVHRQDTGIRFRYRLVGTAVVQGVGRDVTGKWYEDIYPDVAYEEFYSHCAEVVTTGEPNFSIIDYKLPGREFVRYSRLSLPLAEDGSTVDRILSMLDFEIGED